MPLESSQIKTANIEAPKPSLHALRIERNGAVNGPDGSSGTRKLAVIVLIVAAVLALSYFIGQAFLSSPPVVQTGLVTMTSPAEMASVLTASGYVVASRKAAVGSKGTGRLVWLGVEEGSHVTKGEIIGRLEDADVEATLNQTQASLAAAQATLENAQAGFANADSIYRRDQILYRAKLISSADFTSARAAFRQAEALVNTDAANVRLAQRGVQAAQVQVEFTNIRAPFDGTVLTKDADVGDIMTPFGAASGSRADIVSLADMSSLDAEVDVSEANIEQVHVGQPCEISLDAVPEKQYRGIVHMIVPTADRSKATILTKVDFLDRDARVLPEMSLKVMFLRDSAQVDSSGPKLTVPAAAVVSKNGQKFVFVVQDNHLKETPVTLGESVGNGIEVKTGVKDGDKVVLNPGDKLKSGMEVKEGE